MELANQIADGLSAKKSQSVAKQIVAMEKEWLLKKLGKSESRPIKPDQGAA
ncbi:MAG TPA: hypothetical protein VHH73_07790 [Verrucomicrobiae bacterium]|nr:hypothetical protein [Verrucomicrobiae bacterium]